MGDSSCLFGYAKFFCYSSDPIRIQRCIKVDRDLYQEHLESGRFRVDRRKKLASAGQFKRNINCARDVQDLPFAKRGPAVAQVLHCIALLELSLLPIADISAPGDPFLVLHSDTARATVGFASQGAEWLDEVLFIHNCNVSVVYNRAVSLEGLRVAA